MQAQNILHTQKEHKELIDDFICEMQSDLAKTYTQILLSPENKNFNSFVQNQMKKLSKLFVPEKPPTLTERIIPYLPEELSKPQKLVQEIRARRGGHLLNLDRILLYNDQLAQGWNSYFGSLRSGLSLEPKTRELAICYVGMLNNAEYEVYQHIPEYVRAGGFGTHIDDLRNEEFESFDKTTLAVLKLCEQITFGSQVDPQLKRLLIKEMGSNGGFVELVALIAGYNCCSRMINALQITPEGET